MKAMILAAGRGSRLRPLTDTCPKPLVKVNGKPLIVYHLENLSRAGIKEVVINIHHLGEQIVDALGHGEEWDLSIRYSQEPVLLETGGGICSALPLLGKDPFVIVNGDIWTDFDFADLPQSLATLAHLVLVGNPEHRLQGDYLLQEDGLVAPLQTGQGNAYTYAGIALLHPDLFAGCEPHVPFRLPLLFERAMQNKRLSGEHYGGSWTDVGNHDRLQSLERTLMMRALKAG